MRKTVAILLLLIILFQATGVFVLFKLKQAAIRQEVKARIKSGLADSETVELRFSVDSKKSNETHIKWVKSYEFIFEGQLYDVVKQKVEGSEIIYYCLQDFKESKLLKNLDKIVGNVLGTDKAQSKTKTILMFHWFFQKNSICGFDLPTDFSVIDTNYIFSSKFWDSPPDFPPPKV